MEIEQTVIDNGMDALIRQAREEKLWLHLAYQDIWMHPNDFDKQPNMKNIGAVNWTLRNPDVKLQQLHLERVSAVEAISKFYTRMKRDS